MSLQSFDNKPFATREMEACVVPVHRAAGTFENVLLVPLGNVGAPIDVLAMDSLRQFMNDYLGVGEVNIESAGVDRATLLVHQDSPDQIIRSFGDWVREHHLTSDEAEAAIGVAIGYTMLLRHYRKAA